MPPLKRLEVHKTYKLFINGGFPRSESGRYYVLKNPKGVSLANVCLSSRKDFRDAVVAARAAFPVWSTTSAYNRSQVIYRMAEMLEGRKAQFVEELKLQGAGKTAAAAQVDLSIDRLVYYAGWCDKYSQLFSSVNPVASPHYNFSAPEPTGVVAIIAPEEPALPGLVSVLGAALAGANTVVVLASESFPLSAITLGEVLQSSDLSAGVVNLLTGRSGELHSHFSSHMDVNALVYCRDNMAEEKTCQENCSLNVKRYFKWSRDWSTASGEDPYLIMDLQEIKTTWHPIEFTGGPAGKY